MKKLVNLSVLFIAVVVLFSACKNKNNIEAEFALRDMKKPMGVSEFLLVESLPENLKSSLPTIEEIEKELSKI